MKKLLFILMILVIAASTVIAQDMFTEKIMTTIGMSEEQIDIILDMKFQAEEQFRINNAEIAIIKGKLTRELLRKQPNMEVVEGFIKETLRWRSLNEIGTIRLRQQLKDFVGSTTYRKMIRFYETLDTKATQEDSLRTRTTTTSQTGPNGQNAGADQNRNTPNSGSNN